MTTEHWKRVKTVLEEALERDGPERRTFLDVACQGDEELRHEVDSLLASEPEIGDFIETPIFRILPEDDAPPAEGQRIGVYQIVRQIGRGGMGTVCLATRADAEFEKRVALKLVRRGMDTEEIVRRFRAERQILAHLDHENIAKLFDGGTTEDGRPYFVMEYVEGQPIDDYCNARKLSVPQRLELFRKVCSAVHFAHQNLVVHRDLKPGNIVVTADGVPKLLDFGIAKLLNPEQEIFALTRMDLRPMTPEYASPEQVRGEAITTASDGYSLGVLLYGLLTGHSPYRTSSRDPQSLVKAICEEDPARPSSVVSRPEEVKKADSSVVILTPESISDVRSGEGRSLRRQLSGDLDNIVLMAMSKEPPRRYASVDQLSNDIGRYLQDLPVVARKDTVAYRTAKFVARHKLGVSLAAAFLLLILGSSIAVTFQWRRAESEKTRAEAVARFLDELFANSNPKQSRGEDIKVQQVLEQGAKDIEEGLADQPIVQADLMETMGRAYRGLGLYPPARPLLEGALRLHQKELGKDDPRVIHDLHNLALLLMDLEEDSTAEPLIRKALALQRQRGDTLSFEYAVGVNNLAAIAGRNGQLNEAEALYKESLSIKRKFPKPDPQDTANSLDNLGKLYQKKGDLAAAEVYYREGLAIRRRLANGRSDVELATSLNNLATLLEDLRDLAGAEKLHREALAMRRKLFGERNINVVSSLNNLAHVLQAEGKAAAAELFYREALSIAEERLKRNHPTRAVLLRNLASVLVMLGKAPEAEAKVREALPILRASKRDPWRVADAESVLGSCLAAQGRFKEAELLLLRSYPVLKQDSGGGAQYAPEARQRIVDLYKAWGRPELVGEYRALP